MNFLFFSGHFSSSDGRLGDTELLSSPFKVTTCMAHISQKSFPNCWLYDAYSLVGLILRKDLGAVFLEFCILYASRTQISFLSMSLILEGHFSFIQMCVM